MIASRAFVNGVNGFRGSVDIKLERHSHTDMNVQ
jgi:hypothetical protein